MPDPIIVTVDPEVERARLRAELDGQYGADNVYDREQMLALFDVEGFIAPLVVVRRKSDDARGTLFFTASPRFYYLFERD